MRPAIRLCMVAAATILAGAASAQTRPAAPARAAQAPATQSATPPPVSADPARTTASFGDWTLRCEKLADGPRLCEVATSVMANTPQGQTSTIAQVAIGRPGKGEPLRLTVVLPTSVSFGMTPRLAPDEKAKAIVETAWRRCLPSGCFADASVDPASLQTLKARAEPARIVFRDGIDREVALPISVRGLSQALDGLAKEEG